MSKRILLLSLGLFFFFQFVFFSYLVHENLFTQFDFNTTVKLQDRIPSKVDNAFSILSEIGKFEIVTIVLLVMIFVVRRVSAGIIVFIGYIGFHVIEVFGKWFVDHPPPPQFMLKTQQFLDVSQFHIRAEFSYPSGHAGRAIFLGILLIILVWQAKRFSSPIKMGIICAVVGYVFMMLLSRVYLGEHWTSDVVGGTLLGAAMGLCAGAFLLNPQKPDDGTKKHKRLFPKFRLEIKKVE